MFEESDLRAGQRAFEDAIVGFIRKGGKLFVRIHDFREAEKEDRSAREFIPVTSEPSRGHGEQNIDDEPRA